MTKSLLLTAVYLCCLLTTLILTQASSDFEERLFSDWCLDCDSVTVQSAANNDNGEANRGLFASRFIGKGEIVASVHYEDLGESILLKYPELKSMVDRAWQKAKNAGGGVTNDQAMPSPSGILTLIHFLLILQDSTPSSTSKWASYIESLPDIKETSHMSRFWSEEEKQSCIPDRRGTDELHSYLEKYTLILQDLKSKLPLLASISPDQIQWAALMLKTRGFAQSFLPVLDLANHNPLKAHPAFLKTVFINGTDTRTATFVATRDIQAGEELFNMYGNLSPITSAEQYGFVEEIPNYFHVPSIRQDLMASSRTRNEALCTNSPSVFYGNIREQWVVARSKTDKNAGYSSFFKPFMPNERTYACIRVLLQSEDDQRVASYVAARLKADAQRYREMANAPHCQSLVGISNNTNARLIQKANRLTADLMTRAADVAMKGSRGELPYPGISTYTRNSQASQRKA